MVTKSEPLTIDEAIDALQRMREIAGGKTRVGTMRHTGAGHGDPGWQTMVGFTHADLHHVTEQTRDSDGTRHTSRETWARFQ